MVCDDPLGRDGNDLVTLSIHPLDRTPSLVHVAVPLLDGEATNHIYDMF